MKVWILYERDGEEGDPIINVYSSLLAAERERDKRIKSQKQGFYHDYYHTKEYEVQGD